MISPIGCDALAVSRLGVGFPLALIAADRQPDARICPDSRAFTAIFEIKHDMMAISDA
jgi:hypothetical protein